MSKKNNPFFIAHRIAKNHPEAHAKYMQEKEAEEEKWENVRHADEQLYEKVSDEALIGDIKTDIDHLNDDTQIIHPLKTWNNQRAPHKKDSCTNRDADNPRGC